jgi:hypothetical protein
VRFGLGLGHLGSLDLYSISVFIDFSFRLEMHEVLDLVDVDKLP